ncbi:alpha-N-acetylglucosaminidase isoform X2 [Aplysia californica]|nr:alpha-N-acetylglucosaminidase isoform X2 [Aplysia californica]XP_012942155.1 alpha-N-acetylglucosaminidase isoform X2 [Aplysia californica]
MPGGAMLLSVVLLVVISTVRPAAGVRDFPELSHLKTKTSPDVQREAARGVISRLVKDRAADFDVDVNPDLGPKERDTFRLSSTGDGRILIEGTTGVAVSMGFYHYIKYWCNAQRTWAGQQTELPPTLPVIEKPVVITSNDRFRYYKNVCTESYSFVFWQWDRWEQEIDWMVLHGINMPLAFTGQEAIFQRVYARLGFTQEDLNEHFGGPAFLAWSRMGNMRGWGGPLPQMWITNQLILQHQVLQRMRDLGMIPVLGGFAGHVPAAITKLYPHANVTRLPLWAGFNSTYSATYLLDFEDPLFQKIGGLFIQETIDEYGTDHIYNADTFNEMLPASNSSEYIAKAGRAVYHGMIAGDNKAVWLMQGWLFMASGFWGAEQVKALVTSVPQGRMIILDLATDLNPIYAHFQSYYGQPFIWCMLHNFGGTSELFGSIDVYNTQPFKGRSFPNSSMIGIGITPEGINQNEVVYEFMAENTWRTEPRDIFKWVEQYALQRYGANNAAIASAWTRLMSSVYNSTDGHHDNDWVLISERPSTNRGIDIWYRPLDLFLSWEGFLTASQELEGNQLFRYDITDVTRNSLQIISYFYYFSMMESYKINDTAGIKSAGGKMSSLLADMDHLLNANDRFLVGRWIRDARSWGSDDSEKLLLEYNARNQITLWGPNGEIVDYAAKQWAGVVAGFYKPRWEFFTSWLVELVQNKTRFDSYIFAEHIMAEVETPWTKSTYPYPTEPKGNPVEISKALFSKYLPVLQHPFFDKLWQQAQSKQKSQLKPEPFYKWRMRQLLNRSKQWRKSGYSEY